VQLFKNGGSFQFGPLFVLYVSIIKLFTSNYHVIIAIDSIFDLALLYAFLKRYSCNKNLALLVFLFMGGFGLFFNLIRNIKSILFFMLSLRYIRERRPFMYIALNVAGGLFHTTGFLFLPLYFFLDRKISQKGILLIALTGIVVYFSNLGLVREALSFLSVRLPGVLGQRLNAYMSAELYYKHALFTFGFFERLFTIGVIAFTYDSLIERDSNNIMFINIFIIFFVFEFYFAEVKIIPERAGTLFCFAYCIIWPSLVRLFPESERCVSFMLILAICFAKGLGYNSVMVKYDNLITGIETYQQRSDAFYANKDIIN
jgi:hypothetical protein